MESTWIVRMQWIMSILEAHNKQRQLIVNKNIQVYLESFPEVPQQVPWIQFT
jgi:hypothetical protein